ncbi:hypothetical protein GGC64_006221 [Mycobacterium sp. OAS707]|nr:hypothetical protein [Mycobacterium sp. OAS707]MBE1552134.1 hypothetical protein [Mycobacterium sp. OAS707]
MRSSSVILVVSKPTRFTRTESIWDLAYGDPLRIAAHRVGIAAAAEG